MKLSAQNVRSGTRNVRSVIVGAASAAIAVPVKKARQKANRIEFRHRENGKRIRSNDKTYEEP